MKAWYCTFPSPPLTSRSDSQASPAYAYETAEMRRKYFRHVSEGGWPFSTAAHGWPISDCTAEGLKAVLLLRNQTCIKAECTHITDERLYKALNVLLELQAPPPPACLQLPTPHAPTTHHCE